MAKPDQIPVQRLMNRFKEASADLYLNHFDDDFVADRFVWVEDVMFLVMVLNYLDLSEKKPVYPEIALHPRPGAEATVQGHNTWMAELSEGDLLHFRYLVHEDQQDPPSAWDNNWLVARIAESSQAKLVGRDVVLDYSDCVFVGSVDTVTQ